MHFSRNTLRKRLGARAASTFALCLLFVAAGFVFIRFNLGEAFYLMLRGETTTGEAEAFRDAQWRVKFHSPNGSIYGKIFDAVAWHPSQNPEILYDLTNPSRFILRGEHNLPMLLCGVLLLAASFLLTRELRAQRRQKKRSPRSRSD